MIFTGVKGSLVLAALAAASACGGNTERRLGATAGQPGVGGSGVTSGGSSAGNSASGGRTTTGGSSANGGSQTAAGAKTSGGAAEAGGNSGIGGAASTGGAAATGGLKASGGAAGGALATGGKSATGGALATGGVSTSGGTPATGGKSATGGSSATGGGPATGGKTASGGSPATGGQAATGGVATGGAIATGGSRATGGLPATGGMNGTGGTPPCLELLRSTAAVTAATAGLTVTTEDFTRQASGSPVDPTMFSVIYGDSYFYHDSVHFQSIGVSNQGPGTVSDEIVGTGSAPTHITSMIGSFNGYDGLAALFASPQLVVAMDVKGSSNPTGGYSFVVLRSDGAANQTFTIPPAIQSVVGVQSHCGAVISSVQVLPNTGASTGEGTEYWELYSVAFAK